MRIELLVGAQPPEVEAALADVLVDCVAGGASVGFLDPLDPAEARTWWHGTLSDPNAMTWVGREEDGRTVGAVRRAPLRAARLGAGRRGRGACAHPGRAARPDDGLHQATDPAL